MTEELVQQIKLSTDNTFVSWDG